ncbi:MAG: DUF3179 domain-containing protein [Pseudomonadota bacterium]
MPRARTIRLTALLALLLVSLSLLAWKHHESSKPYNGFDVDGSLVPADEILSGGPPRDGIPALFDPEFVAAGEAGFLDDEDRVLGVATGRQARAYPVRILNWHEVVNDILEDEPLLVTYCPLCGTGMVFKRPAGDAQGFGVSGLLYNSDMLLYDRASESLWSQILGQAVSGPRRGEKLEPVAVDHTTWSEWRARHPYTLVLSTDTGYRRDYARSPYGGYASSEKIWFPVANRDKRYPSKAAVIGLVLDGEARVWPFSELKGSRLPLREKLAGRDLRVHFDADASRAWITDGEGNALAAITSYWFAWMAFYPESSLYQAGQP